MSPLEALHECWISKRRIAVIAEEVAVLLPINARVLDIGTGDGKLAAALRRLRGDVTIVGVDVLRRGVGGASYVEYDGRSLPFRDSSFDAALLIDVLHHTLDAETLLREASRVAGRIILKDHLRLGVFAAATLRFMDRVGNERHGVSLPCIYRSPAEWDELFGTLRLQKSLEKRSFSLYPFPLTFWFDRSLHFIADLERI
jgi:SAM-dependent methyltransferase